MKEEAAGDYVRALSDYEEAARYAPFDVTIVGKGTALRSRLLREHLDGAERQAVEGNIDGAAQQLAAALELDPGNPAILERLQQIGSMKESPTGERRAEPAEGLPQIAPDKTNKNFNLQTDVKSAYEQVAQAFGLKASFDPDLQAHNARLQLQDVDFYTAMKVLGMETNTFWNAVDSKKFLVADDTAEKRRALDPEIEETIPVSSTVTTAELGEVVRAIRELTGITHLNQSNANHSITVRGTVQRVHLADEIVRNLDHGPGEVLLEIDLLEVDRTNARNLGITWPANQRLVPCKFGEFAAFRTRFDVVAHASGPGIRRPGGSLGGRRNIQPGLFDPGGGCRWRRQEHVSPGSAHTFGAIFGCSFPGAQRQASVASGPGRQTGHFLCRRPRAHNSFLALGKSGYGGLYPEPGRDQRRHPHAAIQCREKSCRHGRGGFPQRGHGGSRHHQPDGQHVDDPAESGNGSGAAIRAAHKRDRFNFAGSARNQLDEFHSGAGPGHGKPKCRLKQRE